MVAFWTLPSLFCWKVGVSQYRERSGWWWRNGFEKLQFSSNPIFSSASNMFEVLWSRCSRHGVCQLGPTGETRLGNTLHQMKWIVQLSPLYSDLWRISSVWWRTVQTFDSHEEEQLNLKIKILHLRLGHRPAGLRGVPRRPRQWEGGEEGGEVQWARLHGGGGGPSAGSHQQASMIFKRSWSLSQVTFDIQGKFW